MLGTANIRVFITFDLRHEKNCTIIFLCTGRIRFGHFEDTFSRGIAQLVCESDPPINKLFHTGLCVSLMRLSCYFLKR